MGERISIRSTGHRAVILYGKPYRRIKSIILSVKERKERTIMDTVYGTYYRTLQDGYNKAFVLYVTDITGFLIGSPYLNCEGVILHKVAGLPLKLNGRYSKTRKTFFVEDYEIITRTENDVVNLLSRFEIKKSDAKKIARESSNNIFEYFKDNAVIQKLQDIGISQNDAETVYMWCNQVNDYEAIYRYIKGIDGDLAAVDKIYNKYGHIGADVLKENPYMLLYAGFSFADCESLAKRNGIEYFSDERIHALVRYIIESDQNAGNARINIQDIITRADRLERKQGLYKTDPIFILAELSKHGYVLRKEDDVIYVYTKQTYTEEVQIISAVKRLCSAPKGKYTGSLSISELESMCGITYGKSQRETLFLLDTPGIKVLTGGPGTGKTTTLNGILTKYIFEHPDGKILLCAPTGCAAKRITESTGMTAFTIHKALDIRPFNEDKMIANREILDYDCVVVDESSMIDMSMFAMLVSALKTGTTLLLVGDKDQLESVGYGDVLNNVIGCGQIEVKSLDVNYRQGENNSIIMNAQKINHSVTSLLFDEKSRLIRKKSEKDMISDIVSLYVKYFDANDPNSVKIYTPTRKDKLTSSTNLNNVIKKIVNPVDGKSVTANGFTFSAGDFVMMRKNNYDAGYMNGDVGIIRSVDVRGYTKRITVAIDNNLIEITNATLSDMELAYAQTIHKAQGSECRCAIIVLPEEPRIMLTKKLVYVAATRAKKINYFISENNALEQAIRSRHATVRNTGLTEKLKNALLME